MFHRRKQMNKPLKNYKLNSILRDESMRMTKEEMLNCLDTALTEKQFVIYIQPQFNHSTKQLVGGEALVRWIHPEHGMQSPLSLIHI